MMFVMSRSAVNVVFKEHILMGLGTKHNALEFISVI